MMSLIKRKLPHKGRVKGNIILLTLLVIMAFNLPLAEATEGPIAEYHFDGNAQDSSGHENHGTIYGSTFVQGVSGQALSFDGVNDYVEVTDSASLDLTGAYTLEAWIYQRSSGSYRIIDKQTGGTGDGYTFDTYPGGRLRLCAGSCVSATTYYSLNVWHHVIVTFDNRNVKFYLDGTLDGAGTMSRDMSVNNLPLKIGFCGGTGCSNNFYFDGIIDEVRIYSRALSADEISQQNNFAPIVAAPVLSPEPSAEGSSVTASATFSDPDADDGPFTCTVNYGDGSGDLEGTVSEDACTGPAHTYGDNGDYTVSVSVSDNTETGSSSATHTVNNVVPVVNAGADATINEGATFSSSGSFSDPGSDSWTATVDYGDSSGIQPLTLTGKTFDLSHIYADNGAYTVTVTVNDDDSGTDSDNAAVTVNNVAPVILEPLSGPTEPLPVGSSASVTATFTDVGTEDTHTCTFSWDDDQDPTSETGGSCTGTQTFNTAGVYTVSVTITDDDGESATSKYEFVVIYDPNGGFVTGGGWIISPPGAYAAQPTMTGKANFGFVSKYKKGANIPTGETEFQFKAGDLNFHSTVYDWLVVAGAKAQYKGSGTINGAGNYGFLLTATDSQISGGGDVDKFRIKIVNKDTEETVVYDNKIGESDDMDADPQAIGGGNIVIHKEK